MPYYVWYFNDFPFLCGAVWHHFHMTIVDRTATLHVCDRTYSGAHRLLTTENEVLLFLVAESGVWMP